MDPLFERTDASKLIPLHEVFPARPDPAALLQDPRIEEAVKRTAVAMFMFSGVPMVPSFGARNVGALTRLVQTHPLDLQILSITLANTLREMGLDPFAERTLAQIVGWEFNLGILRSHWLADWAEAHQAAIPLTYQRTLSIDLLGQLVRAVEWERQLRLEMYINFPEINDLVRWNVRTICRRLTETHPAEPTDAVLSMLRRGQSPPAASQGSWWSLAVQHMAHTVRGIVE